MRKLWYIMLMILMLGACSQEENSQATEDTIPQAGNIEIPNTIFTSERNDDVIDEEEMKSSIKTYLDSSEELFQASTLFEEILYSDQELTKSEVERLNEINKLVKENDENFANYITNNTLPKGYRKESKRVSHYITSINQYLYELDETIDDLVDNISDGKLMIKDIESLLLLDESNHVNGREQKKIEEFLDQKNIDTIAFGRE